MPGKKKLSNAVTQHSNALDLEKNVFDKDDPKALARSLRAEFGRS